MNKYPTPHISGTPDDYGKTFLMPGDPLRSKFIAENFLTDAKLVNNIRGVQGYTGTYKGTKVSVMASGMGMPSIGIYSYELFNFFDVDNIIRVGSAGALQENVKVMDVVMAMGASTDTNFAAQFALPGTFAPIADYQLLKNAIDSADEAGVKYHVGNVVSSDVYYDDRADANAKWAKMGALCVEMETAALYMNAARAGKRALGIFTVSNSIVTGEEMDPDLRRTSFTDMMTIALETAVKMSK